MYLYIQFLYAIKSPSKLKEHMEASSQHVVTETSLRNQQSAKAMDYVVCMWPTCSKRSTDTSQTATWPMGQELLPWPLPFGMTDINTHTEQLWAAHLCAPLVFSKSYALKRRSMMKGAKSSVGLGARGQYLTFGLAVWMQLNFQKAWGFHTGRPTKY